MRWRRRREEHHRHSMHRRSYSAPPVAAAADPLPAAQHALDPAVRPAVAAAAAIAQPAAAPPARAASSVGRLVGGVSSGCDAALPGAVAWHWRGAGVGKHMDTGDATVWRQCECSAQLSWNGGLTILGSGLSVVRRDVFGARGALEAHQREIADEKLRARLAKDRADRERFTGPVHTMASNDDAAARVVPSPAQALLSSLRLEQESNQACRSYGCRRPAGPSPDSLSVNAGEVSVPFLLSASVDLKSGRVVLRKAHYRSVFNTVEYVGVLTCIVMGPRGKPVHVHASALLESMESGSQGRRPILGIEIKLRCEFATATLQFKPQPQPQQQESASSLSASTVRASHVPHSVVIPLSAPDRAFAPPLQLHSPSALPAPPTFAAVTPVAPAAASHNVVRSGVGAAELRGAVPPLAAATAQQQPQPPVRIAAASRAAAPPTPEPQVTASVFRQTVLRAPRCAVIPLSGPDRALVSPLLSAPAAIVANSEPALPPAAASAATIPASDSVGALAELRRRTADAAANQLQPPSDGSLSALPPSEPQRASVGFSHRDSHRAVIPRSSSDRAFAPPLLLPSSSALPAPPTFAAFTRVAAAAAVAPHSSGRSVGARPEFPESALPPAAAANQLVSPVRKAPASLAIAEPRQTASVFRQPSGVTHRAVIPRSAPQRALVDPLSYSSSPLAASPPPLAAAAPARDEKQDSNCSLQ